MELAVISCCVAVVLLSLCDPHAHLERDEIEVLILSAPCRGCNKYSKRAVRDDLIRIYLYIYGASVGGATLLVQVVYGRCEDFERLNYKAQRERCNRRQSGGLGLCLFSYTLQVWGSFHVERSRETPESFPPLTNPTGARRRFHPAHCNQTNRPG